MSTDAILLQAYSLLLHPDEALEHPDKRQGLSYGDEATRERYEAFILRHDTPTDRHQRAAVDSACAHFCEGILEGAEVDGRITWRGVTFDPLRTPYAKRWPGGYGLPVVAYQQELARQRKALVSVTSWTPDGPLPDEGCMVTMGGDPPASAQPAGYVPQWGGGAHVETVIKRIGRRLFCVAGGQTDVKNGGKATAVLLRERVLVYVSSRHELWACDSNTPEEVKARPEGHGKRIQNFFDAGALPCLVKP